MPAGGIPVPGEMGSSALRLFLWLDVPLDAVGCGLLKRRRLDHTGRLSATSIAATASGTPSAAATSWADANGSREARQGEHVRVGETVGQRAEHRRRAARREAVGGRYSAPHRPDAQLRQVSFPLL
jgi:hypothetical protein